jgi:glycosyltransferase involved in cell wall biosynthesis
VDDGSDEKTKNVLRKLTPTVSKLITQTNKGQSAARNTGIAAANGEFILVLDSDDYFENSFIEKALKIIIENPEIELVTCDAFIHEVSGTILNYSSNGGDIKTFIQYSAALSNSMFRKNSWKATGGYDEDMRKGWEDWEFFIRLLAKGGKAYVIQEPLFHYRRKVNSTTSRANKNKYELWKYIYKKNQSIYVANYDTFIDYVVDKFERNEAELKKMYLKPEYKIGFFVLKPFRFLKRLLIK